MPRPEPLVFGLRYASQVIQIRSQYLHLGIADLQGLIHCHTVTLAHSDEPYADIWEIHGSPIPRARTCVVPQNPLAYL